MTEETISKGREVVNMTSASSNDAVTFTLSTRGVFTTSAGESNVSPRISKRQRDPNRMVDKPSQTTFITGGVQPT